MNDLLAWPTLDDFWFGMAQVQCGPQQLDRFFETGGGFGFHQRTEFGRSVRRPVARAAGSVALTLEKYDRVMQPRQHGPQ